MVAALGALLVVALLAGCGLTRRAGGDLSQMRKTGSMELDYAEQFSVDYYDGGYALLTLAGEQKFLLVPEGAQAPEGVDATILTQPVDNLYVAASSAMDLFDGIGSLDRVHMTSTKRSDWSLPSVAEALDSGSMQYVGAYSAPDFEALLSEHCGLAVESTMIYHTPDTQEQLERLGIPVLVEHSSYEAHPLGRLEWIKLYGLLMGKQEQAERLFDETKVQVEAIEAEQRTGKTVAYFSVSTNGAVTVRKPGDYISKMIEMAGGSYVPTADDLQVDDSALSTMNMQMEAFYAAAKDADILIYNSTIEGGLDSLDQLLEKSEVLDEFAAVQSGNVWCTEQDMFQKSTGTADMIADLHAVLTGKADDTLPYLHRLH